MIFIILVLFTVRGRHKGYWGETGGVECGGGGGESAGVGEGIMHQISRGSSGSVRASVLGEDMVGWRELVWMGGDDGGDGVAVRWNAKWWWDER